MTFPQMPASQTVRDSQELYRLTTELDTSGDIYEIDVSSKALAIGPNSDIAAVNAYYYYLNNVSNQVVHPVTVSVNSPFVGRVDARNDPSAKYPGRIPGRILVTPADIVPPIGWTPLNANPATDIISVIRPRIDLLTYFSPPSAIAERRADFFTRGRLTILGGGGGTWIAIPFYRRKFLSVRVVNTGALAGRSLELIGNAFTLNTTSRVYEVSLGVTALAAGLNATTSIAVRASTVGLFDYIIARFTGAATDGAAFNTFEYLFRATDEEV